MGRPPAEVFDPRPALLVHMARQSTAATATEAFPLIKLHGVISGILTTRPPVPAPIWWSNARIRPPAHAHHTARRPDAAPPADRRDREGREGHRLHRLLTPRHEARVRSQRARPSAHAVHIQISPRYGRPAHDRARQAPARPA